jgi:hypothetical protein
MTEVLSMGLFFLIMSLLLMICLKACCGRSSDDDSDNDGYDAYKQGIKNRIRAFAKLSGLNFTWSNLNKESLLQAYDAALPAVSNTLVKIKTTYLIAVLNQLGKRFEEPDLCIHQGDNCEEKFKKLNKTYRNLALKTHPDKSGGDTVLFQLLNKANEDLSNIFNDNVSQDVECVGLNDLEDGALKKSLEGLSRELENNFKNNISISRLTAMDSALSRFLKEEDCISSLLRKFGCS